MTTNAKEIIESKKQWAKDNPGLCIFPWEMFDIRRSIIMTERPYVTCCCNLDERKATDNFDIEDPFGSIRDSMNRGQLPPECHRCSTEEAHGGTSERIRRILSETDENLHRFAQTRQLDSYGIRIKFSNLCVQACRSCHPHDSSVWHRLSADPKPNIFEIDVTQESDYWKLITESIQREVGKYRHFHIDLMGGETMIQEGVERLLKWICEQGYESTIEIRITTSLSSLPARVLELLTKFRSVLFMLSIDTVGDNYRYVRWPVEFSKIEENLNYIVDYSKNFQFLITPVFSLNNIFYLADYLDYWQEWFKQHRVINMMNTNITVPTAYLDFQALPVRYRSRLLAVLEGCLEHEIFTQHPRATLYILNFIQSTMAELQVWEDNPELWNLFLKFTAEFDIRTKTKFGELNSRLYDILDENDRNKYENLVKSVDTTQVLRSKAYLLKLHNLPY
jgi:hypothetical protein